MFHLAAFAGAKTDSTANETVPAVVDNAWTVSANNRYIAPGQFRVFAAQAINDTITRARINAPSMRSIGLPEIYPVTVANVQGTSPAVDYKDNFGPILNATEEFGVDASNGASTIDFAYAALWLRDRPSPPPTGRVWTIVGTSTITLVARAWAQGTITLDQTLPFGNFSVIGAHAVVTNGLWFRLIFPGDNSMRPGAPCVAAAGSFDSRELFRKGNSGEWGRFKSTAQPTVEIMGNTAGAQTATVYLDIVPLSVEPNAQYGMSV